MTDPTRRLRRAATENAELVARLEHEHIRLVAAVESSNADDEHDPEGATLAWEREQLAAALAQATRIRDELAEALAAVETGRYGVCERCGRPIDPERLEALPRARTCITCAAGSGSSRRG